MKTVNICISMTYHTYATVEVPGDYNHSDLLYAAERKVEKEREMLDKGWWEDEFEVTEDNV